MKENFESDLLEKDSSSHSFFTKIKIDKEINPIKMGNQCGERCPQNGPDHRGACYLDFGHSSNHKCSVDSHEWS